MPYITHKKEKDGSRAFYVGNEKIEGITEVSLTHSIYEGPPTIQFSAILLHEETEQPADNKSNKSFTFKEGLSVG